MRRLYLQVYLTIIAGLLAVVVAGGALWRLAAERPLERHGLEMAGELASYIVPTAETPRSEQKEAIEQLAQRLRVDIALYDADMRPVAASGRPLPAPRDRDGHGGVTMGPGGPALTIALPDGRWLVVRGPRAPPTRRALGFIGFLAIMGGLIALIAWPVARRLTGRLERLQGSVERLGRGDLTARVEVEGRDEVARLAASFNEAAQRIETLVAAHKMLIANASHEIRTPLARIRLGVELMQRDGNPARAAALTADIADLDAVLDDILLSSRLDAVESLDRREAIDLLALAAEEAAHYANTTAGGEPVLLHGDATLLRRLVRNLIDNASRHGKPPIDITVRRDGTNAVLTVSDAGPGIRPDDIAHVFEPFRRGTNAKPQGGAGLGLALVRQIARRHGGDARVADAGRALEVRIGAG